MGPILALLVTALIDWAFGLTTPQFLVIWALLWLVYPRGR